MFVCARSLPHSRYSGPARESTAWEHRSGGKHGDPLDAHPLGVQPATIMPLYRGPLNDPAPGTFKGVLWAGRLLVALLIGPALWSAAVTAVFLDHSVATTGRVVRQHYVDVYYPTATSRIRKWSTSYVDIAYSDMNG